MIFMQRSKWKFFTLLLPVLLTALLAACGSASTATGSTTASTPTTACLTVTTGTIQGVSNSMLSVTTVQGKTVQTTLTSKTIFTRQATLTSADIKTGQLAAVTVMQNPDTTYTALAVTVGSTLTRQAGGFRGGVKLCNSQRTRGNGTPGAFGGGFGGGNGGNGGGQNSRQTISGTVSQLNGTSLVVTDASGNNFTITLTATTRISTTQTVTASDLQTGEAVTITGSANSQGVITASSVSILQSLPIRRVTPTPTSTPATNA